MMCPVTTPPVSTPTGPVTTPPATTPTKPVTTPPVSTPTQPSTIPTTPRGLLFWCFPLDLGFSENSPIFCKVCCRRSQRIDLFETRYVTCESGCETEVLAQNHRHGTWWDTCLVFASWYARFCCPTRSAIQPVSTWRCRSASMEDCRSITDTQSFNII